MQFLFIITCDGQAHTCLSLRPIVVNDALTHMQRIHIQQVADISFYGLESGCTGNFGNLDASALGGEVKNHPLMIGQLARLTLFEIGVGADGGLAFHLETGW